MHKHVLKNHKGNSDVVIFDWKIKGKYKKPLSRQLAEAILIDKKSTNMNMNSKNEFFSYSVTRPEVSEGDPQEIQ